VLAAVGAFAASAYWGLLTLLLVLATAAGGASATNVVLPVLLIGLYAWRGIQALKGDGAAVRSLLALHGIGGVLALLQLAGHTDAISLALQGLKVVIHLFGGVMAYLAHKAAQQQAADHFTSGGGA
jgi:hypothetical protein